MGKKPIHWGIWPQEKIEICYRWPTCWALRPPLLLLLCYSLWLALSSGNISKSAPNTRREKSFRDRTSEPSPSDHGPIGPRLSRVCRMFPFTVHPFAIGIAGAHLTHSIAQFDAWDQCFPSIEMRTFGPNSHCMWHRAVESKFNSVGVPACTTSWYRCRTYSIIINISTHHIGQPGVKISYDALSSHVPVWRHRVKTYTFLNARYTVEYHDRSV